MGGPLGTVAEWLSPSLALHAPTALIAPSTAGLGWVLARRLAVPFRLWPKAGVHR
jgi:hypothetical protein